MAKFIYRMQSILNIKEKLEEQARMEFAAAKMHLDEEEEKMNNLFSRKLFYEELGRGLRKDSLKVREIIENREAIERMQEYINIQKVQVQSAEKQLEEARKKLTEAMQESKTQAKLREKAFDEFVREENAREAREVDELTSYTYGQKK